MAVTMKWKVYGLDGHRQRESFNRSSKSDFSADGFTRIIEIQNADVTGTNEYSVVIITRDSAQECFDEFWGQITDGIFENYRVGNIEKII